ncbi:MAG: hypothetical protein GXP35_12310 [Actinobacteria bacterium]|nr:hypothetical protein [Actinomycetota bacterium]
MTRIRSLTDLTFKALGGQPAFRPGDIESFVDARRIAVLAYVRMDGRPNQVPIWYTYKDGTFFMTTVTDGPKHRALSRSPRVCITIQDEKPPYKAVIIDGEAKLAPVDHDNDPTAGMAVRYFGKVGAAAYDKVTKETYEAKGLTLITVAPSEIKGFDNTQALSAAERGFIGLRERLPIPRRWL